jgi:hypothetical protein
MKTNTNQYRNSINKLIVKWCDGETCIETEEQAAQYLFDRFRSEYDYVQNRKRTPDNQRRVAEWLSGLPIGIPFWYADILETAMRLHDVSELSEKQESHIVENWFDHVALFILRLWEKHNLSLPQSPIT